MLNKTKNQKGIALILTTIIMSVVLIIVLSISKLMLIELKLTRGLEDSFIAYYAAESGVEFVLDSIKNQYPLAFTNPINQQPLIPAPGNLGSYRYAITQSNGKILIEVIGYSGLSGTGVSRKLSLPASQQLSNSGGGTWGWKAKININNFQPNFQTKIIVDRGYSPYSEAQADFEDLRFYDENSGRELPYWIESISGLKATIWFKTPKDSASQDSLYLYWGNINATKSAYLNGDYVFEFFDDFEGSSLDTSKWEVKEIISATGEEADAGSIDLTTNYKAPTGLSAKAMRIYKNTFSDRKIFARTTNFGALDLRGKFIHEYWLYQTGDKSQSPPFSYFDLNKTQAIWHNIHNKMGSNFYSWYYDNTYNHYAPLLDNQWVKFHVIPDTSINKFDVFIYKADGSLYTSKYGADFRNPVSTIDYIDTLGWTATTYTNYVDNVVIRKYASPEPTTSLGTIINLK